MSAERGFTLLELLIGMTLLGFILALLFGGFRLAANSWDAVEGRLEQTNDQQLARALVRGVLTQMQPLRWKKAVNQRIAFVGERYVLRGVAPLTGQAGAGGLRLIELSQESGEPTPTGQTGSGPLRLVLRHAPLRYDADDFAGGLGEARSHLLLGDLTSLEFSYFGPEKRGEPPRWQEVWANPEQLPLLVRLRLGSRDNGWAELVVAPVVGATGCLWDNFYKRCMS